jgi:acyl-CoA synthetase (AMP-forming)/AMP-acid ligase II
MIVDQKEFINRGARYFQNKLAVVYKGGKPNLVENRGLTFSQVNDRAKRLANILGERGFRPGTRVATLMHNCMEYLEIEFALMKGGFPQVVVNPMLSGEEILFQINNSEADVLILQGRYAEMVGSIRDRLPSVKAFICFDAGDTGMLDYEEILEKASSDEPSLELNLEDLGELRYSGGTTGTPKGIMLPFKSAAAVTRDLILDYLGDLTSNDKWLAIQPLFHGAGWFNLPVWIKGMTNYIVNDFHAETALEVIEKEKITAIKTIPTVLMRLLDYPGIKNCELSSIKTIIYGGEPIPERRLKEAIDIFGPVFFQLYGQTEAPMVITVLKKEDHLNEKLLKSVGRPCTMVKVKVVDKQNREVAPGKMGEIIVKGDQLMMGYLNNPVATNKVMVDSWMHTKDLGTIDEDGYIYLTGGRTSDMIISGGENIFPQEVERVLYLHPAVKETCVFGIPNEKWGEAVTAAVVLQKGMTATEKELVGFCKKRLASYKKPQSIYFLDDLPKSGTGKTVRKDLVKRYSK